MHWTQLANAIVADEIPCSLDLVRRIWWRKLTPTSIPIFRIIPSDVGTLQINEAPGVMPRVFGEPFQKHIGNFLKTSHIDNITVIRESLYNFEIDLTRHPRDTKLMNLVREVQDLKAFKTFLLQQRKCLPVYNVNTEYPRFSLDKAFCGRIQLPCLHQCASEVFRVRCRSWTLTNETMENSGKVFVSVFVKRWRTRVCVEVLKLAQYPLLCLLWQR